MSCSARATRAVSLRNLAALGLAACLGLLASAASRAADDGQCALKRVAQLEAKVAKDRLLIKAQVDGQDLWLDISTASPISMLTSRTADRLKLKLRDITGATVISGNGRQVEHFTRANKLTLAGMTADNVDFLVLPSAPPTADDNPDEGAGGGLGADFLSGFDLDLNLPKGTVTLFSKDHCPGHVVYWTQDYAAIPFKLDTNDHIWFSANLDGHEFRTLFDTASEYSVLSAAAAHSAFDIDPARDGAAPAGFNDKGTLTETPYYLHPFATLDIGGVAFHNPDLIIIRDRMKQKARDLVGVLNTGGIAETQMTLGLRQLTRLHIYVAYGEKMLYVSAPDTK